MEVTKVDVAQSNSRSLRTAVPAAFARTLGIDEGTELGRKLKAKGKGSFLSSSSCTRYPKRDGRSGSEFEQREGLDREDH